MRLALAQINPTVGDIEHNAGLILRAAEEASARGADLCVTPELSLCGYPPRDLLLQEGFIARCARAADALTRRGPRGLTLIVGLPLPADTRPDGTPADPPAPGRLHNSLIACRDGRIVATYHKRLLPTYDVFDEDRYFRPGAAPVIIEVAGVRVGLSICEDLWKGADVGFADRYLGLPDPARDLVHPPGGAPGAQVIINPSASPFVLGKGRRHRELLRDHAKNLGVHVASVNQVGGNDELIFDGHAAVFDPSGVLRAAGPGFESHVTVTDLMIGPGAGPRAERADSGAARDPLLDAADESLVYRALVLGVRDYCRKTGFRRVLLGVSGGIDSAVTAVIAAAALGPENVLAVALPSRYSSPGSITDAGALAYNLTTEYITIPIEPAVASFETMLAPHFAGAAPDIAEENIQSRVRGTTLMALSNKFNRLLLTTGNKSELAVGYCTLYGDMNGGLAVISDLSKTLVYRLARWINAHRDELGLARVPARGPIPESTLTKPPSAELRPDQTDQDTLPPYDDLDAVLERYVERRQSVGRIVRETGLDPAMVAQVARLVDRSEFKRKQAAVGLKVTALAFGTGRRVPIAQGWVSPRDQG